MTIVTESAVIGLLLFSRITSSMYQGELELIAGVMVTPPLPPPPPSFTVRLTVVVLVMPPPAPVTVTVAPPSVAVLDAERVRTLLLPVAGFAPKFGLTPIGNPLALNVTPAANPPVRAMLIVLVPLAPRLIVRLAGFAERVKSGGCTSFTVRLIVTSCDRPPPLPVTVTAAAPSVAVPDAESVRTLLLPVAGLELKLALTPPGTTPVLSVMALVKPPVRVMVIVLAPLAPRLMVRLVGEVDSVKSGVGGWFTVRLI